MYIFTYIYIHIYIYIYIYICFACAFNEILNTRKDIRLQCQITVIEMPIALAIISFQNTFFYIISSM
jgi:hypothetical protein